MAQLSMAKRYPIHLVELCARLRAQFKAGRLAAGPEVSHDLA